MRKPIFKIRLHPISQVKAILLEIRSNLNL